MAALERLGRTMLGHRFVVLDDDGPITEFRTYGEAVRCACTAARARPPESSVVVFVVKRRGLPRLARTFAGSLGDDDEGWSQGAGVRNGPPRRPLGSLAIRLPLPRR
jgi:hypothetical protein